MNIANKIRKVGLRVARKIIPHLPRGRSLAIRAALYVFGDRFEGVITTPDGTKFYIRRISLVKRQLFFGDVYEEIETDIIKRVVNTADCVIDVGSSFGWYTILMSKLVGPAGKVFAFELIPSIARDCLDNISLNRLNDNIVVESLALGEHEGAVNYIYSDGLGLGNLNPKGLTGAGSLDTGVGSMTTLDHYVEARGIHKVSFIKCDVDGAEVLFLKGAQRTLSAYRPILIIEASGAHGRPSCREIFEELSRCDYLFFSLHYKRRLKTIEPHEFNGRFKENILCLPNDKLDLLQRL